VFRRREGLARGARQGVRDWVSLAIFLFADRIARA
jgi:hypothetical protein